MNIWVTKSPEQLHEAAEHSGLKKTLTAWDLAALGIGSVVGAGIFASTGKAALLAGPAVIISFIVAAITAGLCALTYSELAAMFPVSGSTYSYSYVAFGELIAWIIGWDLMLEYLVSAAGVASAWSGVFQGLIGQAGIALPKFLAGAPISEANGIISANPGGFIDLPAVLVTLFITWILYIGVKESANMNNIMVIIKIAVVVLFIVLGCANINVTHFKPFMPFGWGGVMAGAAAIFFAYIGFDAVATAAEETEKPERDVPLGLVICLGVIIVIYIGVAIGLIGLVSYDQVDVNDTLPAALSTIGIGWGSALVAIGGVLGMISTLLVTVYGQIRIFMVMSRDGLLPKYFATIHPKHKTPHICTWITGIATALIAGFLPLPMILDLCVIGTLFAFILVSIGVIILRKTKPEIERKFKCPGVPFTPLLTIFFCVYLMISLGVPTWIRFFVWLIIGLIIYFSYSVRHSELQKAAK